jgi:hypothetical protein
MKVQVVSDERGQIVSMSNLGGVRGVSGIAKAGILPKPGQTVHILEVPAEFEKQPLLELHRTLRVEGVGDQARLVRLEHFISPFLKSS